jgi:hypothetical protein
MGQKVPVDTQEGPISNTRLSVAPFAQVIERNRVATPTGCATSCRYHLKQFQATHRSMRVCSDQAEFLHIHQPVIFTSGLVKSLITTSSCASHHQPPQATADGVPQRQALVPLLEEPGGAPLGTR